MRAWTHTRSGNPHEVLTLSSSVAFNDSAGDASTRNPNTVIVRIHYAALNPGGSIMLQLCPFLFRNRSLPAIPELDFAGEVISSSSSAQDIDKLHKNNRVFGSIPVSDHLSKASGSLAEFVQISSDYVVHKPFKLSLKESAGLGVAGCTALTLMDNALLKEGDIVLINGASGGIGSLVIQLSKAAVGESGSIVAVCSGTNEQMVRDLGADEVIDYQKHTPLDRYLATTYSSRPFDCVIDCYGIQPLFNHCDSYLKEGKPFVTVGVAITDYTYLSMMRVLFSMIRNFVWPAATRKYVQVMGVSNREGLRRLSNLVEEGKIKKVHLDSCWEMEDVLQACSFIHCYTTPDFYYVILLGL
ncbi:NAD(P)-binding protein [Marasmius fiardii PR-910]|nr:NAD(P)-binding protein [Marasmius fiardii PR-910]